MHQDFTLLKMSIFPFMGLLRILLLFVSQDASVLEPDDFAILDSLWLQFACWVLNSAPCLSGAFHEEELSLVNVLPLVRVQEVQAEEA